MRTIDRLAMWWLAWRRADRRGGLLELDKPQARKALGSWKPW